ncbi:MULTISPECIES: oligosaccharide flippase family protein [Acidobacteriaceae]|uniref:oligosaccharide flippase family protein n=1 Tax=Acidobacteriaceae TaxID=204434 RepID=UPI00131D1DBC|nr:MULTISPECIES: oligosaccharide flippase family protein [Acidobacteriaceae]MDW5265956.1 oligosaccharide flippase family protein [Edaphobacter sp.]
MKSIVRATAMLSGSSVVTILVGLVSAKALALLLQPSGYGYYGLIQSVVAVASLVTGMGIATGMVRQGAGAASRKDELIVSGLRNGAWALFWVLGGISFLVLILFREPLSRLGGVNQPVVMPIVGVIVLFTVANNIQTGMLNTYHRVAVLATYAIINSVVCAGITILAVLRWHSSGIVIAILGGAIASWAISGIMLRRHVGRPVLRFFRQETLDAAWSLLQFGGAFTVSTLVGTGVQLALPIVVFHLLSTESVGYYKAASAIAVGYLGFIVTAMGQDYFPRVSAERDNPKALVQLINEQHRLVMLLAAPIILGTLALVPYLVPLVYSRKFSPAVEILEWQLIGDLFKFSSWTMSFAILARCKSSIYFLTESIGGATTLVTTWIGVRLFGLPGLGIASLVMFIIYYAVTWVVIRREIPLIWTAANKKMMLAAVSAATIVRILPSTRFADLRTPIALAFAAGATILSMTVLWHQYREGKDSQQRAKASVAS